MKDNQRAVCDRDSRLENLAAELTTVAYSVVLRRGVVDQWLDLELELWEALKETIHKRDQEWPQAGVMLGEAAFVCDWAEGQPEAAYDEGRDGLGHGREPV